MWMTLVRWLGLLIAAAMVLIVAVVLLVTYNKNIHQQVLSFAEQKAEAALGTPLKVRDYRFRMSGLSPTVDLYNIVVDGAAPYPTPPLLQADHVGVGVTVSSLLHASWYLNHVTVDRPVARVYFDKQGDSNLPKPTSSNSQSSTNVFELGVRHAELSNGEVYYNDRKSPLDADLHDLTFRAGFDSGATKYFGTLSYRDGHLQFGIYDPVPHDFAAQFEATPEQFHLVNAVLDSGNSHFTLNATVEDYSNPRLQAKYEALLDSGEFRLVLKNPALPVGMIRLSGQVQYQNQPNRPMVDLITLKGDLNSQILRVQTPQFRGNITGIGARYGLANGDAEVSDLRAGLLGGELTGNLAVKNLSGASHSQLHAALRGVSLAELKSLMKGAGLQQVALTGTANANADATWGKTLDDLVAHADATVNGNLSRPNIAGNRVPLNASIHGAYAAASKEITLNNSYLRTPETSLNLNGTVSNRSSLQVQLQSKDLHELEMAADLFRTPEPGKPVQPLGLYGTASFNGTVRGSTSAPHLTGQLVGSNLRLKGSSWKLLRTNISASPSQVSLQNGELQPATRGQITFDLSSGLRNWSFTETSPIQAKLNASQLNVAELTQAAGSSAPVSGTLSAQLALHGSELNPVGQGSVNLTQAKISGQPVQQANITFQGTGDEVHANLAVKIPAAGSAQGNVSYRPKQKSYTAQLQAVGIKLDQLEAVKDRNMQLTGVLNLTANGQGTIDNPQLTASLQIPQLTVQQQKINNINLQTTVANHVANIALDSQAIDTSLRARATVNITGDYETIATLDTQAIPLQPVLAIYAPAQAPNITGQTELHATLKGPLKNKALLNAHVTIPTLQVNYQKTLQIGAAAPIHIDYSNGVLALQRTTIRGTGTELEMQASIPSDASAPASMLLLGTVDLKIAQLFSSDITSSGLMKFNINSYGARANPNIEGQINIVNANFVEASAPVGLTNGNGVLTLTKDRIEITKFEGEVGGGTVSASGGVNYRPAVSFDLALAGNNIRLLYPQGVREGVDLNLALNGNLQNARLGGQVKLNQMSFTPDFELADLTDQFSGGPTPPPTEGFSQNLNLDVDVQSTGGINLVSRTLSLQATSNLHVRGTAAEPVILGRVNLNGGDMIFNGNRFILQGGTIDFVNATETQPVMNVSVKTTIQQYDLQLQLQGPMDHLHTNYTSVPALPPSDIINLLAFGQTSEASAANPTPGNLGAESAVASQVSSQVTSRVSKIAGISQLSIDPILGGDSQGSSTNPGARITVQQRVTGNIFVTFATDVTDTQNQVIQLQYQMSPRVSFSGSRDQNGGFGFDTRIHKTW